MKAEIAAPERWLSTSGPRRSAANVRGNGLLARALPGACGEQGGVALGSILEVWEKSGS